MSSLKNKRIAAARENTIKATIGIFNFLSKISLIGFIILFGGILIDEFYNQKSSNKWFIHLRIFLL